MAAIAHTSIAGAAKNRVQSSLPGPGDSARQTGVSFDTPDLDQHLNGGMWNNALHEVRCSLAQPH